MADGDLGWGDYFRRDWPGPRPGAIGLPAAVIWGRIVRRGELDAHDQAHVKSRWPQGWRYAWCYSTAEPDGEPGPVHVDDMIPVTAEQFAAARARGWAPECGPGG